MSSLLPEPEQLRVLVLLTEHLNGQPGWVRLDRLLNAFEDPGDRGWLRYGIATLERLGYCSPAGAGDLVYVTKFGTRLARAVRCALRDGETMDRLTLDSLTPWMTGYPAPL